MQPQKRAFIIGLTGGIASGKSSVGRMLRELGAEVVDADEVAREVVKPGRPAYDKIVAAFGQEILQPADPEHAQDSAARPIHRELLAARVFADESARRQLNAITHPEIAVESARRIREFIARGGLVGVYEATLLVENKVYAGLDGLIVVDLPESLQLERAEKRGLPRAQAQARMAAQASRTERNAVANWVIDNRGSEAETKKQVEAVWEDLRQGVIPPAGQKPAG